MEKIPPIEVQINEEKCFGTVRFYSQIDTSKSKPQASTEIYSCWRYKIPESPLPLFISKTNFENISPETLLSVFHLPEYQKEWNPANQIEILQSNGGLNDICHTKMRVRPFCPKTHVNLEDSWHFLCFFK